MTTNTMMCVFACNENEQLLVKDSYREGHQLSLNNVPWKPDGSLGDWQTEEATGVSRNKWKEVSLDLAIDTAEHLLESYFASVKLTDFAVLYGGPARTIQPSPITQVVVVACRVQARKAKTPKAGKWRNAQLAQVTDIGEDMLGARGREVLLENYASWIQQSREAAEERPKAKEGLRKRAMRKGKEMLKKLIRE